MSLTSPPGSHRSDRIQIACPLCEGRSFAVLYLPTQTIDDPFKLYGAASGVPGVQTLVQCKDCGLIYENPRFNEDLILAAYSRSDDQGHGNQHDFRKKSFLKTLKNLSRDLPAPGAKVLDVGSAGGAFLEAASEFGYQAVGLEPSNGLASRARARGLNMQTGTTLLNNLLPESFDLITFWDVLEHLCNPRQDLLAIRRLLKPGGKLLINYPDIGTWMAKIAGRRFWWLLSVHLTHFTRATISEICNRTGFTALLFRPYWQILQIGYLEAMAIQLKVPGARLLKLLTPAVIQGLAIPYYASQTTALAVRNESL